MPDQKKGHRIRPRSECSSPDAPTPASDRLKAQLIRHLCAELGRTGRRYLIDLDALDVESLRELLRLLKDLDQDKDAAVRKARLEPWSRW